MAAQGLSRRRAIRALAAGGAGLALIASRRPGTGAGPPLRFTGFTSQQARAATLGIASYRLSIVGARPGLVESAMRALADAAHGDLLDRLAAAGLAPLPPHTLRAAIRAGGSRLVPGNRAAGVIGRHREPQLTFGAGEAPLLFDLESPVLHPSRPFAGLAEASARLGALLLVPAPVIAIAEALPGFNLAAASRVLLMTPFEGGESTVGGMMLLAAPQPVADKRMLAASLAAFNAALVRELAAARSAGEAQA